MTSLRGILLRRGAKAVLYRPLSVGIQILGLFLILHTANYTLPLLGIDVVVTLLYYAYDFGWEKWVMGKMLHPTLLGVLERRGAKAIIYRPLSIFVQIYGLYLLTNKLAFVYPLLGIDVIITLLYFGYDAAWEKWVMPKPVLQLGPGIEGAARVNARPDQVD